ncbi:hypothetical protein F4678DRAFT_136328 [Xylaria arbuscula]|nr:hypothetical protein F4678DRAFT_136328 [Xylaria arbuscula]
MATPRARAASEPLLRGHDKPLFVLANDGNPQPQSMPPEPLANEKGKVFLPEDDEGARSEMESLASSPVASLVDETEPSSPTWPPPSADEPSSGWAKLFRYDPYLSLLNQALQKAGIEIPEPETVLQTCFGRGVDFIRLVYLPCTSPKPGWQEYRGVPREKLLRPIRVDVEPPPTWDPPSVPGRSSSLIVPEINTQVEEQTMDGQTVNEESAAANKDETATANGEEYVSVNGDGSTTHNGI